MEDVDRNNSSEISAYFSLSLGGFRPQTSGVKQLVF